jgi:hypothetical protein
VIKRITLRGTGTNPFTLDEDGHQLALDTTFATLRDALQNDPEADVSAGIAVYKDATERAVTQKSKKSLPMLF